jgi:predicted PurR-regulated permease PerM
MSTLAALLVAAVVAWLARDLLIPIALACFLAFLLHPLVERLERWGVRRVLAVLVVTVAGLTPVLGLMWVVATQVLRLVETLPQYEGNIRQRIETLQGPARELLSRGIEMMGRLQGSALGPDHAAGTQPLPVTVAPGALSAVQVLKEVAGPVLRPLAVAGIVVVFVVFILAQWSDLRDRVVRLISGGRLTTTTTALEELTGRIGEFLRMQFVLNVGAGVVVAVGLSVIGVPNAMLWGFLAGALRYIPYLGYIVATALPLALTIATSQGWGKPLLVLAFMAGFEIVNANFIEPYLYGNSTGISSMAFLAAAIFWGWLWGIPGLLLATPLTVCLVVLGRYVPELAFLRVLLGDEPVLAPPERVYQRLVAMNADEATEVAEEYLKDHTLVEAYDDLLIPALRNADIEREEGTLDGEHQEFVHHAVRDLIEDLARVAGERAETRAPGGEPGQVVPVITPHTPHRLRVLCVPARDESDALAGMMLEMAVGIPVPAAPRGPEAQVAGAAGAETAGAPERTGVPLTPVVPQPGIGVRALSVDDLGTDLSAIAREYDPDLILTSAVPPHASLDARWRAKQVRRKVEGVRLGAGLWGLGKGAGSVRERMLGAGFVEAVGSIAEAVAYLNEIVPKTPGRRERRGRRGRW